MCYRDGNAYEVKETKVWGPKVLAFWLITGRLRYYVVGCYIPPSELERKMLDVVKAAWDACPAEFSPLLLDDLNINLGAPQGKRDITIDEECDFMGLQCLSTQFRQRRCQCVQGRWSWRQQRRGRWILPKPDYFMAHEGTRKRFRRVVLRRPRHHLTDHRALVGQLYAGRAGDMKAYRRKCESFPLHPIQGPLTAEEAIFEELRASVEAPPARERKPNAWVREATWSLVNKWAALCRGGDLSQVEKRQLS